MYFLGTTELILSDDIYDCDRLNVSKVPLLVTLCKVGDKCIIDPTAEEEECSVASLVVGVSCLNQREGVIATMRTNGEGSLSPETLREMSKMSLTIALVLNKLLMGILLHEEQHSDESRIGFL